MIAGNVYYVYGYLRSVDSPYGPAGSFYYIGKGKGNRAINKTSHRVKDISKDRILMIAEGLTEDEAFRLEIALIYVLGRIDLGSGCLRNMTDGGNGASGRVVGDAEKIAASVRAKGRVFSSETKALISQSKRGSIPWNKGIPRSEETKRKSALAQIGKTRPPFSNEHKEKIAIALRGKKHSDERRRANSMSHRKAA